MPAQTGSDTTQSRSHTRKKIYGNFEDSSSDDGGPSSSRKGPVSRKPVGSGAPQGRDPSSANMSGGQREIQPVNTASSNRSGDGAYASAKGNEGGYTHITLENEEKERGQTLHKYAPRENRTKLRNWRNLFRGGYDSRWTKAPHFFHAPKILYDTEMVRYRDFWSREAHRGSSTECYISSTDGRLQTLVVQADDSVLFGSGTSTWRRTHIRNTTPWQIRLALWPIGFKRVRDYNALDWWNLTWRWFPSCFGLLATLSLPMDTGTTRNNGFYDPVYYRDWDYPKVAKNRVEEMPRNGVSTALDNESMLGSSEWGVGALIQRETLPRRLVFLKELENPAVRGHDNCINRPVKRWRREHDDAVPPYVFLIYTSEQFNHEDDDDMDILHDIGEQAVMDIRADKRSNVVGFWVGATCMDRNDVVNDVYRISDTIRGAARVVIALKQPRTGVYLNSYETLLKQVSDRMWIFPEILLATPGKSIRIYQHAEITSPREIVHKRQLAARMLGDPQTSRQLLERIEGSLELSRLEFITLALKCLSARTTTKMFNGDLSYVLMGLQSRRPEINTEDSDFEAFARLSLSNDSDRLLERKLCTLPVERRQPYYDMRDYWGASLWDIEPTCQISGFGDHQSVIIDGVKGASIRWKSFKPVAVFVEDSFKRFFARICLRGSPVAFVAGLGLFVDAAAVGFPERILAIILLGSLFLGLTMILIFFFSPFLVKLLYTGKTRSTQAWFFGFEGYADLDTIEQHIFGGRIKRLQWSTYASTLSVHGRASPDTMECKGLDPVQNKPEIARLVERARNGKYPDGQKVFTLVDTVTMTVMLFQAVRPPTVMFLCGREGGMQRAVACSFDVHTKTFYREAVFRMETQVKDFMTRVARCRIGMDRVDFPPRHEKYNGDYA